MHSWLGTAVLHHSEVNHFHPLKRLILSRVQSLLRWHLVKIHSLGSNFIALAFDKGSFIVKFLSVHYPSIFSLNTFNIFLSSRKTIICYLHHNLLSSSQSEFLIQKNENDNFPMQLNVITNMFSFGL